MNHKLRCALAICGALAAAAPIPARAQDAGANIERAQQTLSDLQRLLEGIAARQARPGVSAAAAADPDNLFNGQSLGGWRQTAFRNGGRAHVESAFRGGPPALLVDAGTSLSGITWTGEAPKTNYEITLETMKVKGLDFMCGLTFPVADSHASLILGGWGGNVVGISSVDGQDASENETSRGVSFETDRWYAVRLRVTPQKIEAWLDGKKIVDLAIAGRKIGLRFGEISKSVPLGLATYQTSAAYRNIRLHRLDAK